MMTRIEMKNYNLILTQKQQKNEHYYHATEINLEVKKYYLLIKVE